MGPQLPLAGYGTRSPPRGRAQEDGGQATSPGESQGLPCWGLEPLEAETREELAPSPSSLGLCSRTRRAAGRPRPRALLASWGQAPGLSGLSLPPWLPSLFPLSKAISYTFRCHLTLFASSCGNWGLGNLSKNIDTLATAINFHFFWAWRRFHVHFRKR